VIQLLYDIIYCHDPFNINGGQIQEKYPSDEPPGKPFRGGCFYVMEMLSMMMAKMGYIPTLVGAWFPVVIFIALGAMLLIWAKT
jgi:hypothetical protein